MQRAAGQVKKKSRAITVYNRDDLKAVKKKEGLEAFVESEIEYYKVVKGNWRKDPTIGTMGFIPEPTDELTDEMREFLESAVFRLPPKVDEMPPAEADAYIHKMIQNKFIDWHRKKRRVQSRLSSFEDMAETGELDGQLYGIKAASQGAQSDYPFLSKEFRQHLLALPFEQAVLVYCLAKVEGNVSELARCLGQPQRKVARQVERIRKHFLKHGLGS